MSNKTMSDQDYIVDLSLKMKGVMLSSDDLNNPVVADHSIRAAELVQSSMDEIIVLVNANYDVLEKMQEDEIDAAQKQRDYDNDSTRKICEDLRNRIAAVQMWNPPSDEHAFFKSRILFNMNTTLNNLTDYTVEIPITKSVHDYRKDKIDEINARLVRYRRIANEEKIKFVNDTAFVKSLMDSFPAVDEKS